MVADKRTSKIIAIAHAKGACHDFRLLKESKTSAHPQTKILGDSGYQGLQKIHKNSALPYKKSKNKPLTKEKKRINKANASARITAEHVIRTLKIFRILKHNYRNRRKRFGLRANLIAAIVNLDNTS